MTEDERFMREAKKQAMKAYALREVPIGCVIVYEGKIIARGYNRRNTDKNTVSHAEINAIRKSQQKAGRLEIGGLHLICDLRALSNVRRSDYTGKSGQSSDWEHEPESRLCRFCFKPFGNGRI